MYLNEIIRALMAATLVLAPVSACAAEMRTESDYRTVLCDGMPQERVLPNGTRVDCINDRYAIEVDWSHKWAEAIGQAMSYSATTGLLPAVILICKRGIDDSACLRHEYHMEEAAAHWDVPLTVWACPSDASRLSECKRSEVRK